MHEYTEPYIDAPPAGPSQEETGEYVIDAAYPDPSRTEQEQGEPFRPVPLRVEGEEYLHSHALETGEGPVGGAYQEEYVRQEQGAGPTYVDAVAERERAQDVVDGRTSTGVTKRQLETTSTPSSATGRRRTHSLRVAPSRTTPTTELERALQTFAVPEARQDQVEPRPIRTTADAGPSRSAHPFPQVVPQKRKARQHVSPDSTRTPTSERLPIGRNNSAPQLNGTTHPPRRAATPPFLEEMRRTKISRMFAATTGPGGSRIPEQQMSFSTITLLHGHIVQKSYLKEKR
jgi:hypothetical protein